MFLALAFMFTGCQTDDRPDVVSEGLTQITIPKGSVVQYAEVPSGTELVTAHTMGDKSTTLQTDGYILFIDEQPKYEWEHSFQLVFVPKISGIPDVLFRGSALPEFDFTKPDGSTVTDWKEYQWGILDSLRTRGTL